VNYIN